MDCMWWGLRVRTGQRTCGLCRRSWSPRKEWPREHECPHGYDCAGLPVTESSACTICVKAAAIRRGELAFAECILEHGRPRLVRWRLAPAPGWRARLRRFRAAWGREWVRGRDG
jgi:hypothetical protein